MTSTYAGHAGNLNRSVLSADPELDGNRGPLPVARRRIFTRPVLGCVETGSVVIDNVRHRVRAQSFVLFLAAHDRVVVSQSGEDRPTACR